MSAPGPAPWGETTRSGLARGSGNALPLGTRLGEFTLTRVIGEGGFGIVYEAHDALLDRRVAVKEYMPAELAERSEQLSVRCGAVEDEDVFQRGLRSFINEAKILARFDHPSLVKVYRFWESNGTAYMVMPYYEGPTLLEALRRLRQPPDEAWLRQLLDPLTEALAVIHEAKVYHRDISPDNILLLAGTGTPLLLDFGAARRVIEGANQKAPTAIVKPGYAPIEQYAEVHMDQGPWSDVYALAAVLHFALTGRKPPAAIGRLVNDSLVPLATQAAGRYSPALLAAIDRALVVAPGERTPTMDAFRAGLGLPPLGRDATGGLLTSGSAPASSAAWAVDPPGPVDEATGNAQAGAGGVRHRAWRWVAWGAAGMAMLGAGLGWWARQAPAPTADTVATAAPPAAAVPSSVPTPTAPPPPVEAAPSTAPPVAAPVAFSVVNEFARIQASGTPGHTVGLAWPAGTRFQIGRGDLLSLEVTSSHDGFVYVLVHTPDNLLFQYFPNDIARANAIQRGRPLRIPRLGADPRSGLQHKGVSFTDPPGEGRVLVLVSKHPRDFSRLGQRREAIYPLYPVGDEAAALHQGRPQADTAASIYLGEALCPPGPPCLDEFGAVTDRFDIAP